MRFNFYELLLLYKSNGLRIHVLFLFYFFNKVNWGPGGHRGRDFIRP